MTIVASASPGQRYPDECYMKGVAALVSAARSARDRLSDDTWRVITSLQEELDRLHARIGVEAADHDLVQPQAIFQHAGHVAEQGPVQQADQVQEMFVVALVRRAGQQEQIPSFVPDHLGQFVVLGRGLLFLAQMMGFVEHRQIPIRAGLEFRQMAARLERVDAGDDEVLRFPHIAPPIGEVAAQDPELLQSKPVVQLLPPVLRQAGWADDQHSLGLAPGDRLANDHPRFDGLSQSDFIGHEDPP
jgi:hypothetical protein